MSQQPEKRPREYAAEIISIKGREARQAALAKVPAHLRAMVGDHVEATFSRRKAQRSRRASP